MTAGASAQGRAASSVDPATHEREAIADSSADDRHSDRAPQARLPGAEDGRGAAARRPGGEAALD